jgi:geranylgeranyl diphosphate synthase type II
LPDSAEEWRMGNQTWRFDGRVHEDTTQQDALDTLRHEVEARLAQLLAEDGRADLLSMAMRAGTLGAGKRMRPLLMMLVARDLGCASPALVDVACAVEMVHAASLVLDDMPCMDDARLRRGRPAIHVEYGEDVAILASVALLSRAFCVISSARDIPPEVRTRLVCTLGETVGTQGLVRGQFLDLHGGARSAGEIAVTNDLKTGVLLGAAVDMAAIVAQADERAVGALRAFAFAAGQAFQIRDDFQDDPANDSAVTGKDTGKDVGKATFVNTLGHDEARRRLLGHLAEAERHLDSAVGQRQGTRHFMRRLFGQAAAAPRSHERGARTFADSAGARA